VAVLGSGVYGRLRQVSLELDVGTAGELLWGQRLGLEPPRATVVGAVTDEDLDARFASLVPDDATTRTGVVGGVVDLLGRGITPDAYGSVRATASSTPDPGVSGMVLTLRHINVVARGRLGCCATQATSRSRSEDPRCSDQEYRQEPPRTHGDAGP
jgi:hypothetical protein